LFYGRFWFRIVTARGIFYGYSIEIIGDSHSESDKPNGGEQVQVRFEARFVGLIIIVFPDSVCDPAKRLFAFLTIGCWLLIMQSIAKNE
jgi:hypothetical protein